MNKEEEKQRGRDDEKKDKSSVVIKIPSYQEVLESSQSATTSSLFTPSPSFSQTFSFVKSSQSYTPPPPPPPPPSSRSPFHLLLGFFQFILLGRGGEIRVLKILIMFWNLIAAFVCLRQVEQLEAPSSSSSSPSLSSSAQSRNAILVSHRQVSSVMYFFFCWYILLVCRLLNGFIGS